MQAILLKCHQSNDQFLMKLSLNLNNLKQAIFTTYTLINIYYQITKANKQIIRAHVGTFKESYF